MNDIPNYNTGHFENGIWIPDCNMCGACCRYLFFWAKTGEEDSDHHHLLDHYQNIQVIGEVAYFPAPCRFLGVDNKCLIHEDHGHLRPNCCHKFGYGGFHHPVMCAFFGGEYDKELYPDDYRHKLEVKDVL